MTKKQNELKERLISTIKKGNGATKHNADGTKTFEVRSQKHTAKMITKDDELVEYRILGFDWTNNEQILKANQVIKFENAVMTVEDDIEDAKYRAEYEKRQKEYLAELEREKEIRRNAPDTIKSDYLDNLILTTSVNCSLAEKYILSNYKKSRDNGFKLINFSDLPVQLEKEINEMAKILDESGIKEIGISEASTALIKNLDIFNEYGWRVNGMFKEQKPSYYSSDFEEVNGVRLEKIA